MNSKTFPAYGTRISKKNSLRKIIILNRVRIFSFLSIFLLCSVNEQRMLLADENRPNILLAISDDQSWIHTSAYGSPAIQTPAFDRIAQSGALFTNAFGASPGCSPCRAALLTGRHTWQIEDAGTHASSFPLKYPVFPSLLADSGYHTGYTGKGWGPGNYKISGRTQNPAGPSYSKHKLKQTPAGISKTDYAANFADFLEDRHENQPFLFWYGGHEPHRSYEKGLGEKNGADPEQVEVPKFLPDDPEIRSDILDYYAEIEWFDQHLAKMLKTLEEKGELENTVVIVTSDNGMPFPRAKANCYEYGIHMPLAISWPNHMPGGRHVDDLIGFVDISATILDLANVTYPTDKPGLSGRSFRDILMSDKSGICDPSRTAVFSARERHSSSRYNNWTYPQRAIRTADYLLIHNFRPERWPAGAPQKYETEDKLGPEHGGYHDIDACPSLTYLIENRNNPEIAPFFHAAVDKRPEYELFNIKVDPACMKNLTGKPEFQSIQQDLTVKLNNYLKETGDPRVLDGGEIYESYKRYSSIRKFPAPE